MDLYRLHVNIFQFNPRNLFGLCSVIRFIKMPFLALNEADIYSIIMKYQNLILVQTIVYLGKLRNAEAMRWIENLYA